MKKMINVILIVAVFLAVGVLVRAHLQPEYTEAKWEKPETPYLINDSLTPDNSGFVEK